MEDLRIYMVTYNVGTSSPEQNLLELLNLPSKSKWEKVEFPDIYVLSFQEVKAQPQNMIFDALFSDAWSFGCKKLLFEYGYVHLKSIRLQGLLINVYALRKHLLNVRELESEYTRTGLAGMWGNKGAVSIRLNLYGCSLCFVNSHLSAHDNQLNNRIEDYNSILKDQEFHAEDHPSILCHDYVFWMGDLNFRLSESLELSPEDISKVIQKNQHKKLLEYDQLKEVMKKGEAFSELVEEDFEFPPTFKFDVGTDNYNYKRKPAWCDRILYRVGPNNYENVQLNVRQLSYKSHPSYTLSDHKPVSAEFLIKIIRSIKSRKTRSSLQNDSEQVFSDYSEQLVEFDEINGWRQNEENTAIYKISQNMPKTKEDWIGLYKVDFSSIDDYISYEYVAKCTTPSDDERTSTDNGRSDLKFSITFSELPHHCIGDYCLLYVSQSDDKVTSILGISNSFPVRKVDSD